MKTLSRNNFDASHINGTIARYLPSRRDQYANAEAEGTGISDTLTGQSHVGDRLRDRCADTTWQPGTQNTMGKFFEEFSEGDKFKTPARSITLADITNFAGITGDFNPVHTDLEFARTLPFGERIAHGPMLVGMTFGLLSRIDLIDGTVIALRNIAWDFKLPVRPDDTVHVVCEVTKTHRSNSSPDRGFVEFDLQVVNQKNEIVQHGTAGVILMCR